MKSDRAFAWTVWLILAACGCQENGRSETAGISREQADVPVAGPAETVSEPIVDHGPAPPGQSEPPLPVTEEPDESAENREVEEVSLTVMSWMEAQKLLASKVGKLVVLDLWSTSCAPCRREFPQLVQLHLDHGDEVACISYSMDYAGRASKPPETYHEKVMEFLQSQGATFDNILGSDDPDTLYQTLELAAIPAVYVYDREGNLLKRFDNEDPEAEEFTYEGDVLPFVKELLTKN